MSLNRIGAVVLAFLAAFGCGDKVTVNETEKGVESESCRSRNDCQEGLMCVDNGCTRAAAVAGGDPMATDAGAIRTRSELGESCQTRADCIAPLACIENTCLTGFAPDAAVETAPPRGR